MLPPLGHSLSESDPDEAFDSPIKRSTSQRDPGQPKTPTNQPSRYDDQDNEDAREAILRRELEGVRNINELIEGVVGTLERAKGNMSVRRNSLNRSWQCCDAQQCYLNMADVFTRP